MYMATGLNTAFLMPVRASVSLVLPWALGPSFSKIADLDMCDPQRQSEKGFGQLFICTLWYKNILFGSSSKTHLQFAVNQFYQDPLILTNNSFSPVKKSMDAWQRPDYHWILCR